jgi:hypothetical protein
MSNERITWQFSIECGKAAITLDSVRILRKEVVWPKDSIFECLALRIIELFNVHDTLESVTLSCILEPAISENSSSHDIFCQQHLKLTTVGADPFVKYGSKELFLREYAPLHLMGTGSVSIKRDDALIQSVLSTDLSDPIIPGFAYCLARELSVSFKDINLHIVPGYTLG